MTSRNGFSKIWELRSGSIGVMWSCVPQEMKFGMLQLAILFVFVESLAYNFSNNTNKVMICRYFCRSIIHSRDGCWSLRYYRESQQTLYNNIDTKVCFVILWKSSSLGISSLKKFDIFIVWLLNMLNTKLA